MGFQPGTGIPTPEGELYTLRRLLGKGGFGEVWEAKAPSEDTVALKIMSKARTKVTSFEREMELLQEASVDCNHNVVCFIDAWRDDSWFYLVTEFLPGTNLHEYLVGVATHQIFATSREILMIMEQITTGLLWLHARGIVHRDLKPANIQIDTAHHGYPKATILDLGLACLAESKKFPCEKIVGTVSYIAPEVWKRQVKDPKPIDIFALGVLFHTATTGKRLFYGKNLSEVKLAIKEDDRIPTDSGSEILDDLIWEMTDPDPEVRPSLKSIQETLHRLMETSHSFPVLEGI